MTFREVLLEIEREARYDHFLGETGTAADDLIIRDLVCQEVDAALEDPMVFPWAGFIWHPRMKRKYMGVLKKTTLPRAAFAYKADFEITSKECFHILTRFLIENDKTFWKFNPARDDLCRGVLDECDLRKTASKTIVRRLPPNTLSIDEQNGGVEPIGWLVVGATEAASEQHDLRRLNNQLEWMIAESDRISALPRSQLRRQLSRQAVIRGRENSEVLSAIQVERRANVPLLLQTDKAQQPEVSEQFRERVLGNYRQKKRWERWEWFNDPKTLSSHMSQFALEDGLMAVACESDARVALVILHYRGPKPFQNAMRELGNAVEGPQFGKLASGCRVVVCVSRSNLAQTLETIEEQVQAVLPDALLQLAVE